MFLQQTLLACVTEGQGRHSRVPVDRPFDNIMEQVRALNRYKTALAWRSRNQKYCGAPGRSCFFCFFFSLPRLLTFPPKPDLSSFSLANFVFPGSFPLPLLLGQPTRATFGSCSADQTYLAQMGRLGRSACSTKPTHLQVLIGLAPGGMSVCVVRVTAPALRFLRQSVVDLHAPEEVGHASAGMLR